MRRQRDRPRGSQAAAQQRPGVCRSNPPTPCSATPRARQDFLCGLRGRDFVMVCSDTSAVQSIVTMKQDEDKLVPVDSHRLFAISGEAGDRVNFSEYIIANVRLYALRNGSQLTTKAVANYTRSELATALRKVGAAARGWAGRLRVLLPGGEGGGSHGRGQAARLPGRYIDTLLLLQTANSLGCVQQPRRPNPLAEQLGLPLSCCSLLTTPTCSWRVTMRAAGRHSTGALWPGSRSCGAP